jgi:hypothetical protein
MLQEEERGIVKTPYAAVANLRNVVVNRDGVELGQEVKYLAYSISGGSPTFKTMFSTLIVSFKFN